MLGTSMTQRSPDKVFAERLQKLLAWARQQNLCPYCCAITLIKGIAEINALPEFDDQTMIEHLQSAGIVQRVEIPASDPPLSKNLH